MSSMSSSTTSSLININIIPPHYRTLNPAMGEDTIIEMKDLKEKTVADLFGEQINKISELIQKRNLKLKFISYGSLLSSLVTGAPLMAGYAVSKDATLLMTSVSMFALGIFPGLLVCSGACRVVEINTDELTLYPALLTEFHNEFLRFQEAPQECKIVNLFYKFRSLDPSFSSTMAFLINNDLVDNENYKMFKGLGQIYLMDAVVEILKKQNKESIIVKDWDLLISTGINEHFYVLSDKLWSSIEITSPPLEDYAHFIVKRSQFKSIEISLKVNDLYRQAIEKGLKENKI